MKKGLIFGALGVMALAFASCSSDEPAPGNEQVAQKDEVRFLRVAIANPTNASRAGALDFQDGLPAENLIGEHFYFKFFDATGNPVNAESISLDDMEDVTSTGNVGLIKEAVLQITIERGAKFPAYVLCFLNPVTWNDELEKATNLEAYRGVIRNNFKSGNGNFAMTNSVYFGNDPISGATNVKMSGAPILASQLYTTRDAAEAADASTVDIYVERLAAKVNFQLTADAIKPYTYGGYTLTFNPEFWSINASAPNMYAIKRYADDNEATTTIPTLASVNTMLQGWTTWNDPDNYRSYWACSPSFYADQFPQVSDNIIDKATTGTGAGVTVGDYELCYYSYNQIAGQNDYNGFGKGEVAAAGTSNFKYAMENTMGKAAFGSVNPKAAAPSVVLVGNYSIAKGTTEINAPQGFCLYRDGLYYIGSVPDADATGKTIMNRLLDANEILYTNDGGTYEAISSTNVPEALKGIFTVAHPSKNVRGNQAVPHRYVTLQIAKGTTNFSGLYYKPDGAPDFVPVEVSADQTAEQLVDQVNLLLWQQIGNAAQYTNGKCYFSIPIQHLGMTENTSASPLDAQGNVDWGKVRVGDFGLVRNHVYTIKVTEISGRADGIQGLDNPLVPSMETNDYWVKYRINILNWRIVPEQSTKL